MKVERETHGTVERSGGVWPSLSLKREGKKRAKDGRTESERRVETEKTRLTRLPLGLETDSLVSFPVQLLMLWVIRQDGEDHQRERSTEGRISRTSLASNSERPDTLRGTSKPVSFSFRLEEEEAKPDSLYCTSASETSSLRIPSHSPDRKAPLRSATTSTVRIPSDLQSRASPPYNRCYVRGP